MNGGTILFILLFLISSLFDRLLISAELKSMFFLASGLESIKNSCCIEICDSRNYSSDIGFFEGTEPDAFSFILFTLSVEFRFVLVWFYSFNMVSRNLFNVLLVRSQLFFFFFFLQIVN